jgi:hypothetical protein
VTRGLVSLVAGLAGLAGVGAVGCSGGSSPSAATPPAPPPPATDAPTTTTSVPDEAGRIVDSYTPAVGDCFDVRTRTDERGRETTYHLIVDCALPHGHEVFAVVPFGDPVPASPLPPPLGPPHPGAETLRRFARLECPRRFGDYVGERFELSGYGLGYELPTPEQWVVSPAVGCTLIAPDEGRTAGSGRATGQ